jgi:pimeloyl-ACP methyl ester carboxylesterase
VALGSAFERENGYEVLPADPCMPPETRYAVNGTVNIAYQVVGEGPRDLVFVPGFVSNVEVAWEEPHFARFLERLASFSRLILFDKRGTGLSDRVADMPSLEVRMDDVRAVMDAVGSEHAALFGISEGAPMCVLFAATYPERTEAVIMAGGYARRAWAPDHPWGRTEEQCQRSIDTILNEWGGPIDIEARARSLHHDPSFRQWWGRYTRMGASPADAARVVRLTAEVDVRHVLPTIRVPTLIFHAIGDATVDVRYSRYMAERIPGAKYIELPSADHLPWLADADIVVEEVAEFLTGVRPVHEPDRVLATVLFTDIVGATEKAAGLGDRRWHELLDNHHAAVRRNLVRFRGREIDTAGDGFFAAFDGPARAVQCACAVADAVQPLGLEIRAGLHTGECEVMGAKVGGIAVHIGARVAALAGAGEVLVSSTVKDLVAGSGLRFANRGIKPLKGVPGEWHIFAVER